MRSPTVMGLNSCDVQYCSPSSTAGPLPSLLFQLHNTCNLVGPRYPSHRLVDNLHLDFGGFLSLLSRALSPRFQHVSHLEFGSSPPFSKWLSYSALLQLSGQVLIQRGRQLWGLASWVCLFLGVAVLDWLVYFLKIVAPCISSSFRSIFCGRTNLLPGTPSCLEAEIHRCQVDWQLFLAYNACWLSLTSF